MSNEGSDKRSVSTDALDTLGTVIDDKQGRDAIHLAVEPVVAGHLLEPGDRITVVNGVAEKTVVGKELGIVDPFLTRAVEKGERFWFVMNPRQVRSLRHVWTHPAFPDEPIAKTTSNVRAEKEAAEEFLHDYADELGIDYRTLVDGAVAYLDRGEYLVEGGTLEGVTTSTEFWDHFETVTGRRVKSDDRQNFFSCSC